MADNRNKGMQSSNSDNRSKRGLAAAPKETRERVARMGGIARGRNR